MDSTQNPFTTSTGGDIWIEPPRRTPDRVYLDETVTVEEVRARLTELETITAASVDETIAPAPPTFDSREWLRELTSNIGVSINDIPVDICADILSKGSKSWVNRAFFEWFNARSTQVAEFSNADAHLFATSVSLENSPQYREVAANVQRHVDSARQRFNDAETHLRNMAEQRVELMRLKGQARIDLTEEVKKIIAGGWFKYESELTHERNRQDRHQGLVFTTPRVNLKFFHALTETNIDVDMGQYKVVYIPGRNELRVFTHHDNVHVDGYYHPHVSDSGLICWGNAANTHTNAMRDLTPSKSFAALAVILQNFNDESPYRSIQDFLVVRRPEIFANKPVTFGRHNSNGWVEASEMPDDLAANQLIDETDPDDDEEERRYLVKIYTKVYEGTPIRVVGESDFYVKLTDVDGVPRYKAVSIYDWE